MLKMIVLLARKRVKTRVSKEKQKRHLRMKTSLRIPIRNSKENKCRFVIHHLIINTGDINSTERTNNLLTLLTVKDMSHIRPLTFIMHRLFIRCLLTITPLCLKFPQSRCKDIITPIIHTHHRLKMKHRKIQSRRARLRRRIKRLMIDYANKHH